MSERDAFLRAITTEPDDDTARLVYADWLQENGDEARAELIRLQIALSRLEVLPLAKFQFRYNPSDGARERELLAANTHRWRTEPKCESCKGTGKWASYEGKYCLGSDRCSCCHGTGSANPLSKVRSHPVSSMLDGSPAWVHEASLVRGMWVIKATLAELGGEVEKRFQVYPRDEWGPAEYDTIRAWQPSAFALRCVRIGASFEVSGREPFEHSGAKYFWIHCTDSLSDESTLPTALWKTDFISHYDSAIGERRANSFATAELALAALNTALNALLVEEAWR